MAGKKKEMLTPARALSLGGIPCREYRKLPREADWFCRSPENRPVKPATPIVSVAASVSDHRRGPFLEQLVHALPAPEARVLCTGTEKRPREARGNESPGKGRARPHGGSAAYSHRNVSVCVHVCRAALHVKTLARHTARRASFFLTVLAVQLPGFRPRAARGLKPTTAPQTAPRPGPRRSQHRHRGNQNVCP